MKTPGVFLLILFAAAFPLSAQFEYGEILGTVFGHVPDTETPLI
jgi:hypothetical protein